MMRLTDLIVVRAIDIPLLTKSDNLKRYSFQEAQKIV